MLTLTYPAEYPLNGRVVKNHWRRMRQWLVRRGNPTGLWFLEFQARGAPHFHVFLTGYVDRDDAAEAWYSIVGSGDIRHLWAGTRVEGLRVPQAASVYAAKYAAKKHQKEVPDGFADVGRFWGTWGKPEICRTELVRGAEAMSLVRMVRRGYQKRRKSWKCRRRFRDNGRAGFTAWESGPLAAQALECLTACIPAPILGLERAIASTYRTRVGPSSSIRPSGLSHRASGEGRQTRSQSAPEERNHLDETQRSLGSMPGQVSWRPG